jgi:uncharacterized protein (DUF1919 family)
MRSPKPIFDGVARRLQTAAKRAVLAVRLRRLNFSIVSNNCWGGHIHQIIGDEYRSPFVGLYLAPECYLNMLQDFQATVRRPLKFAKYSRHDYINQMRAGKKDHTPIGQLGDDIELQFVHYQTEAEAEEKWNRRLKRMVSDENRIFFKFCDRDGCTPEQLATFDMLPFRNKVCFVSRKKHSVKCGVWIPSSTDDNVPDGRILGGISPHYFDGADWLNGGSGKTHWPGLLRFI